MFPIPMSIPKHVLFLLLAIAAVGCASNAPLEVRALPYHIAIAPMVEPTVGTVRDGELPGDLTGLRLEISTEDVTRAMSEALAKYCFAEVTVLDLGGGAGTLDAFERERLILEKARESEADLIVELVLRYDPEIYRKKASTFWLNYPLFLFAGPSNWFVRDNGYYADVELLTDVYDRNALEAGNFALGDLAARVVSASSRFTGSELDFRDRSDGVGDYVVGIFIPSGFLSRESESARAEVHAAIFAELESQLVQGIQSRRDDLLRAPWIAPVFVEPDEVRIERLGDVLVVRGSVRLNRDGLVDRVQAVHLNAGGKSVTVAPSFAESIDGSDVMSFEANVPVSDSARSLHMRCEAGSRDRFVRSYTFEIPGEGR